MSGVRVPRPGKTELRPAIREELNADLLTTRVEDPGSDERKASERAIRSAITQSIGELSEAILEGRLAIKTFNQSAEPTATDLPAGKFCFWTDTDDSKLYICYNHGGTIKTTEMT